MAADRLQTARKEFQSWWNGRVGHSGYEVVEKVETLREDADAAAICCVGTSAFKIFFPCSTFAPRNPAYHAAFRFASIPTVENACQ
jgi:hypothetical protein